MAAVSPILPASILPAPAVLHYAHKLTRSRPPHPSPHPLSLTVSGQGRSGRPPRPQRPVHPGSASSTTPTDAYPNDSARWRDGRVEMASKPEYCIGHRGAEMG